MKKLPHIDKFPESEGEWFATLVNMARYLRSPEGCPWDRKQTSRSFAGYAAEEVRELMEALDDDDNPHIEEEFGDCLFTLLAGAVCAEEEGRFRLIDALERIHEKMLRRHGHVFGEEKAATPQEALEAWNRVKAEERAEKQGNSDRGP